MSDPNAPPLNVERILNVLDRHQVDYILVGGMAAVAYGSDRATFDIDLVPQLDDTNLVRLAAALQVLGAQLRIEGGSTVPFPIDPVSLRRFEVSTWRTDAGDVDVIHGIPTSERGRLAGYEDLAANGTAANAYGIAIRLAGLDDIIASKQALSRTPDLEALPGLRRLQKRLDQPVPLAPATDQDDRLDG